MLEPSLSATPQSRKDTNYLPIILDAYPWVSLESVIVQFVKKFHQVAVKFLFAPIPDVFTERDLVFQDTIDTKA